jgi:hypothetical protein
LRACLLVCDSLPPAACACPRHVVRRNIGAPLSRVTRPVADRFKGVLGNQSLPLGMCEEQRAC